MHGWPARGEARTGAFHSEDLPATIGVDEFDSVWYQARLDRVPPTETTLKSRILLSDAEQLAFGLIVYRDAGPTGLELIDERSAGDDPIEVAFEHDRDGWAYVLVRREDSSFSAKSFRLEFSTDATYLYSNAADLRGRALGGCARLICLDETNGFLGSEAGSDEIQVNVTVNGQNVAHVPHTDALDFDDGSLRDLVMPVVAYTQEAKVELVELDDLSAADRASVTIPKHSSVHLAAKRILARDGQRVRAVFPIDFGDGKYELEITVAAEPPPGIGPSSLAPPRPACGPPHCPASTVWLGGPRGFAKRSGVNPVIGATGLELASFRNPSRCPPGAALVAPQMRSAADS